MIILIGGNKFRMSFSSPKNTTLYFPDKFMTVDLSVQLEYIKMPSTLGQEIPDTQRKAGSLELNNSSIIVGIFRSYNLQSYS